MCFIERAHGCRPDAPGTLVGVLAAVQALRRRVRPRAVAVLLALLADACPAAPHVEVERRELLARHLAALALLLPLRLLRRTLPLGDALYLLVALADQRARPLCLLLLAPRRLLAQPLHVLGELVLGEQLLVVALAGHAVRVAAVAVVVLVVVLAVRVARQVEGVLVADGGERGSVAARRLRLGVLRRLLVRLDEDLDVLVRQRLRLALRLLVRLALGFLVPLALRLFARPALLLDPRAPLAEPRLLRLHALALRRLVALARKLPRQDVVPGEVARRGLREALLRAQPAQRRRGELGDPRGGIVDVPDGRGRAGLRRVRHLLDDAAQVEPQRGVRGREQERLLEDAPGVREAVGLEVRACERVVHVRGRGAAPLARGGDAALERARRLVVLPGEQEDVPEVRERLDAARVVDEARAQELLRALDAARLVAPAVGERERGAHRGAHARGGAAQRLLAELALALEVLRQRAVAEALAEEHPHPEQRARVPRLPGEHLLVDRLCRGRRVVPEAVVPQRDPEPCVVRHRLQRRAQQPPGARVLAPRVVDLVQAEVRVGERRARGDELAEDGAREVLAPERAEEQPEVVAHGGAELVRPPHQPREVAKVEQPRNRAAGVGRGGVSLPRAKEDGAERPERVEEARVVRVGAHGAVARRDGQTRGAEVREEVGRRGLAARLMRLAARRVRVQRELRVLRAHAVAQHAQRDRPRQRLLLDVPERLSVAEELARRRTVPAARARDGGEQAHHRAPAPAVAAAAQHRAEVGGTLLRGGGALPVEQRAAQRELCGGEAREHVALVGVDRHVVRVDRGVEPPLAVVDAPELVVPLRACLRVVGRLDDLICKTQCLLVFVVVEKMFGKDTFCLKSIC